MPAMTLQMSDQTPKAVRDAFFATAVEQMERAMMLVEAEAERLAPSRTGHLRRSFTHAVHVSGDTITGSVGTGVFYGRYLEEGTGLFGPRHQRIYPTRAAALRFPTPGNKSFTLAGRQRRGKAGAGASWVVVRSVAGVKPMHFFKRAFENTEVAWKAELAKTTEIAKGRVAAMAKRTAKTKRIGPAR